MKILPNVLSTNKLELSDIETPMVTLYSKGERKREKEDGKWEREEKRGMKDIRSDKICDV